MFPFYVYDEDGSNRRENITTGPCSNSARTTANDTIANGTSSTTSTASCIIRLSHEVADNLKRELPRIPFAPAVFLPSPPERGRG